MDLSLIQKDILITLISLYHKHSHSIKGEEIADVLKRNPGTVRNQMQALKALGLVEGVPGPKGGYTPTAATYRELNLDNFAKESEVTIYRDNECITSARATEIAFTTLCNPDICQAMIKIIGSVRMFEIGDRISIGPTPVNKLLLKGEITGMDENHQGLIISVSEMVSLPKKPIRDIMSAPIIFIPVSGTIAEAVHLFASRHIHGAPVMDEGRLYGIVTLSDIARAMDSGLALDTNVTRIMTEDVVKASSGTRIYEILRDFKEREIGRLIIVENGKPVGIVTQSDVMRLFPST